MKNGQMRKAERGKISAEQSSKDTRCQNYAAEDGPCLLVKYHDIPPSCGSGSA